MEEEGKFPTSRTSLRHWAAPSAGDEVSGFGPTLDEDTKEFEILSLASPIWALSMLAAAIF